MLKINYSIKEGYSVKEVKPVKKQKETSPAILAYLEKRQTPAPVYLSDIDIMEGLALRIQKRVLNNRVKARKKEIHEYWNEYGELQQQLLEVKKPVLTGFEEYLTLDDVKQEVYCLSLEYLRRNYNTEGITSSKEWRKYHVTMYFKASLRAALDLKEFIVRNYLNVQELPNVYTGDDGKEYTIESTTSDYYLNLFAFEDYSYIETKTLLMDAIKTDAQRHALNCLLADIGREKAGINPKTYNKVRKILRDVLRASV